MIVSNDPIWWSIIDANYFASYVIVACYTTMIYDCALTFGKEVDLIWRQRWSLITVLYLSVRYLGMPVYGMLLAQALPEVSLTDMGCAIIFSTYMWTNFIFNVMLWVIMIARLHAMYQGSRKILIFLITIILTVIISCGVIGAIISSSVLNEELVLSGTYYCSATGYNLVLFAASWTIGTTWEVLALFLTTWVAVKHFRELRRIPAGSAFGDCLSALVKNHVFYFAGVAAAACFTIGQVLSPNLMNSRVFTGVVSISQFVQLFLLGPRLILSVREYHAKLAVNSDSGTGMTRSTISDFQARTRMTTGGEV